MSLLSWCHRLVSCNFLVSALFESAKTQLRLDLAQQRSLGAALTRCRLKQHILDSAPPGPKAVPGLEAAWTRDLAPPARRRDSAPLGLAPPPGLAAAWIWQRLSQLPAACSRRFLDLIKIKSYEKKIQLSYVKSTGFLKFRVQGLNSWVLVLGFGLFAFKEGVYFIAELRLTGFRILDFGFRIT